MHPLAQLDHKYLWHPFTQMRDWLKSEPITIVEGKGAVLRDVQGREYLDANSSIWTNLHGHKHPRLNAAIGRQLKKIAHSSALGFANEPASLLAEQLIKAANPPTLANHRPLTHPPLHRTLSGTQAREQAVQPWKGQSAAENSPSPGFPSPNPIGRGVRGEGKGVGWGEGRGEGEPFLHPAPPHLTQSPVQCPSLSTYPLTKVFFSDDGSTAMEVALKLAYEFARRTGRSQKPRFLSLRGAYHGDTVGAVALGHIALFHKAYSHLLFRTDEVIAPYCYRCPFNRARPERADARDYRKCRWECIANLEQKFAAQKKRGNPYAAFVFEPLMQGAAGMIPQPAGWLRRAAEIARNHGALLIADEVMTGFGRTGAQLSRNNPRGCAGDSAADLTNPCGPQPELEPVSGPSYSREAAVLALSTLNPQPSTLFACHQEGIQPDFLVLAKGLTGGYLPMAATLTTRAVFDAFLGEYDQFKTFFHGHSFTGNQLGASAGLASLQILQSTPSIRARRRLAQILQEELESLWSLSHVGDIRQVGLVAGVELVKNWRTRAPFELRKRAGIRVCEAMARRGVLTRPVGNVIVLMPPYCTTPDQMRRTVRMLHQAIAEL